MKINFFTCLLSVKSIRRKLKAYFFMEKELQNDNQQIITNQMFSSGQQLQTLCFLYSIINSKR